MSSKKQKEVLVAHKIKILVEQGTLLSDFLVLDLSDFTASLLRAMSLFINAPKPQQAFSSETSDY
jgi:hypothetical protein